MLDVLISQLATKYTEFFEYSAHMCNPFYLTTQPPTSIHVYTCATSAASGAPEASMGLVVVR